MGIVKFSEPYRPVMFNLPVGLIEVLDKKADSNNWTRSDLVRHLLDRGIRDGDNGNADNQRGPIRCGSGC